MSRGILLGAVLLWSALSGVVPPAAAQTRPHDCMYCHNVHGGGGFIPLTLYDFDVDLCLSCHGDGGPATYDGKAVPKGVDVHAGSKHAVSDTTSCTDCHGHFGASEGNLALVPRTLDSRYTGLKTVVFTARTGPNSFADGDTTYDGVCEVCHTATDEHRADGSVSQHNAGTDCTTCHGHDSGFAPSGCTGCHTGPQGTRRAVVGEFAYTSHHIDWVAAGYATEADIPDAQCEVCHDQTSHQNGTVELRNVDTGTTVVLTGDPASDAAEATKLSAFCLACHDADGAAGAVPFADGAMPAVIDTTVWSAASHGQAAAVAGCYGNGAFGCHGSGHGSMKTSLLAPYGVAATAPAYAEQEEGFCLNCHDADGPAATDMEARYALPVNWVDQATGLNANLNLNDRHDVQQAVQAISGAVVECVDCHDPHGDTTAQPWRSDPDPANVPTITAMSAYSRFCLDCHDGTYAPGVTPPTNALVNIDTAWSTVDVMGQMTGGPQLSTQTGAWTAGAVMECYDCHDPHPVPTYSGAYAATSLFGLIAPVFGPAGEPLEGWSDTAGDWTLTAYSYSTVSNPNKNPTPDADNGGVWCNTCHARDGMIGKDNCTECHAHGTGKF